LDYSAKSFFGCCAAAREALHRVGSGAFRHQRQTASMSAYYAVNFSAATNADLAQAFQLTDTSGTPLPLDAATLVMTVETPPGFPAVVAYTSNGRIAITEPSLGTFEIRIPAAVLGTVPPGVYRHDLVAARQGRTTRIWSGHLALERGVAA
jgi:hypothetical protein